MKNMKVAAKMTLSFGIILFLTLAVVATVFITTTITNNALADVEAVNYFEIHLTDFDDYFNDALLEASVMVYDIADVGNYANAISLYNSARTAVEQMLATAQEYAILQGFFEPATEVAGNLTEWRQGLDNVAEANIRMAEIQEEFLVLEVESINAAIHVVDMQRMNLETDIRANLSQSDMIMRHGRISNAIDISNALNLLMAETAAAFGTMDMATIPDIIAGAQELEALVETYMQNSRQQHDIDAAEAVWNHVTEILTLLDEFAEVAQTRTSVVAANHAQRVAILSQTDPMKGVISQELLDNIGTANNMGNLSLILSIAMGALALVVGVIIARYITALISKPIGMIVAFLKHASSTGDLSLSEEQVKDIEVRSQLKSEIGELYANLAAFVMRTITLAQEVNRMADGDFSKNVDELSAQDTMGTALNRMTDSLNNMFGEINMASRQVATGSKQIADGSQSLAQGSTEQSASAQQLSSSIAEIAQKTKDNATMAEKAAMLAADIKGSAEKGSNQMNEMTTAVKEINASSQNISKVIKSIDDIAFQTNILALNAAVEAARAGQHGKGFAVVAEEVRNLAAKSAEAAKNTEGLIADSIEKAELGSRIAVETAESLTEIVAGIGEIATIVIGAADASKQQAESISEVNLSVDHVAQVTQQNSATAEQSAAASQEMSGQSDMLEELIARFKLKDDRGLAGRGLPPAQDRASDGDIDPTFGKY